MRMLTALKTAAAATAMLLAAPALAATPVTSGGTLTGATGVTVGGATYDVQFLDGTCSGLFGGCDAVSDFTFQTQASATAAANALLAQVLLGTFDTQPNLTNGCTSTSICIVLVPYGLDGAAALYAGVNNGAASNSVSNGSITGSIDTGQQSAQTFARFTLATTAVPEPASWALMLLGFAGIGLAVRRRARAAWLPAA